MSKKIVLLLRVFIILSVWFFSFYTLHRYEYLKSFRAIDNVIGMLPVALVIIAAAGVTALLWMEHTKRFLPVSLAILLISILSVVLFPRALRGDWWINIVIPEGQEIGVDIRMFTPFSDSSQIVRIDENPALTLYSDLPVLDGATALLPVFSAFAETVFDQNIFEGQVLATGTRGAYEALIAGERDIIFAARASEHQISAAEAAGVHLHFTPIGREALVFLVGNENPIDNITLEQIRNIYSGRTAKWRTLGWPDGGRIIAFQRPEGSGSQTGLQTIMANRPIQAPQPLPDASLVGSNSLMEQISLRWRGTQPAIGYSYRFFATTMHVNPDSKVLSVDGVFSSIENIQNGSYPFIDNFYAVTKGAPEGNSRKLIDWILSNQGQRIIELTGYVPLY